MTPALELTLAGPSYLVSLVLPAVVAALPGARVRALELVPAHLRAYVAENLFDAALVPGGIDNRPGAWTGDIAGSCRSGLFARPAFAKRLGPLPLSLDRGRALPFVGPVRVGGERLVVIGDDCPLPWEGRFIAHEAQTIGAALEFVSATDHVVLGPVLAACRFLRSGPFGRVARRRLGRAGSGSGRLQWRSRALAHASRGRSLGAPGHRRRSAAGVLERPPRLQRLSVRLGA